MYSGFILDYWETEIEQVHFVPIVSGLGEDRTLRINHLSSACDLQSEKGKEVRKMAALPLLLIAVLLVTAGFAIARGDVATGPTGHFVGLKGGSILGIAIAILGIALAIVVALRLL